MSSLNESSLSSSNGGKVVVCIPPAEAAEIKCKTLPGSKYRLSSGSSRFLVTNTKMTSIIDQRCDGRCDESTNNCSFRLGETVRGSGVDAGCCNAQAWWDDAGTSRIQTILILRVHGTYKLGTKKRIIRTCLKKRQKKYIICVRYHLALEFPSRTETSVHLSAYYKTIMN